jgi:hypothetical protein
MGEKTVSSGAKPVLAVPAVVRTRLEEGVHQLRSPPGAPLGRDGRRFGVSVAVRSGRPRLLAAALRLLYPDERLLEAREGELPGQRALFMPSSPHSGPPNLYRHTRNVLWNFPAQLA